MSRQIDDERRYNSDLIAELSDEIATLQTELKDMTFKMKGMMLLMVREKGNAEKLEAENAALKRENTGLLGIVSAYHPEHLRGCDCPQCSDATLLTAEESE